MLTYGLKKGTKDVLLHIDSVPNGKSCDCECPHCHHPLIARNYGKEKEHHFAHASGADCGKGRMTALHIMAQNILKERKTILLPPYKTNYVNEEAQTKIFKEVLLEEFCKVEDTALRPDCNCISKNPEAPTLWVEIYCRHKVDDLKRTEIIHRKQYCIEVDFRDLLNEVYTVKDVIKRLESDSSHKEWICCPVWDDENKRIINQAQEEHNREVRQRQEEENNQKLLVEDWKKEQTPERTKKIIHIINSSQDSLDHFDLPLIIKLLVPNDNWIDFFNKHPKTEAGREVFYAIVQTPNVIVDHKFSYSSKSLISRLLKKDRTSAEDIALEYLIMLSCLSRLSRDDGGKEYYDKLVSETIYRERMLQIFKEMGCFEINDETFSIIGKKLNYNGSDLDNKLFWILNHLRHRI